MVNSRCFISMKNRVKPDSQLFNILGCNSWGKGMGCPLPSRLGGLGERRKLRQRGPGQSPGRKQILEYLELENTHLISLPLIFPWPLWNSLTFPSFPAECHAVHEQENQQVLLLIFLYLRSSSSCVLLRSWKWVIANCRVSAVHQCTTNTTSNFSLIS